MVRKSFDKRILEETGRQYESKPRPFWELSFFEIRSRDKSPFLRGIQGDRLGKSTYNGFRVGRGLIDFFCQKWGLGPTPSD